MWFVPHRGHWRVAIFRCSQPYLRKVPDVTTLLEILEKPRPWRISVKCVSLTCAHTSSITLFEGLVQIAYACRYGKE
jgi:hypothetical protein